MSLQRGKTNTAHPIINQNNTINYMALNFNIPLSDSHNSRVSCFVQLQQKKYLCLDTDFLRLFQD